MDFQNEFLQCKIDILDKCQYIHITGIVPNFSMFKNVIFVAANPVDSKSSYSGKGLPFPCADIAFDNTKNVYKVESSGVIDIKFTYPNSYYNVADKIKIISSVFVIFEYSDERKEFIRLQLPDMYELRTLVNRESRKGPEFYSQKYDLLPIDTGEMIMKEYAKLKISNKIA